jgi:hypothetical protein
MDGDLGLGTMSGPMNSTRVLTASALAVLAGLIIAATALAATSPAAKRAIPVSHLVVTAAAPTTASATLTYTDTSGISIDAEIALDGPKNAAQIAGTVSLDDIDVSLTARLLDDELYVDLPAFATLLGAPWTDVHLKGDERGIDAALRELRHPFIERLVNRPHARYHVTEPTAGVFTLRVPYVTLPETHGLPVYLPHEAHLDLVVRLGPQGQVLAAQLHLWNKHDDVRVTLVVTGYDQALSLRAPPHGQLVVLNLARSQAIFGDNAVGIDNLLEHLGAYLGPSTTERATLSHRVAPGAG